MSIPSSQPPSVRFEGPVPQNSNLSSISFLHITFHLLNFLNLAPVTYIYILFLTLHRDAGVILSALLEELSFPSSTPPPGLRLLGDLIKTVPQPSVLELGTGCGIVAITFALSVPDSRVIATDLEEAAEVASDNLEQAPNTSYLNLDWSEPLPLKVAHENFDLILVADCTYNPDVVPYLVSTLAKLITKSPSVLICLAMKVRHASEAVFFDLMKEHGIVQVGKHSERVGNLGDEDESVDIYLFKGAEAAKVLERASGLV
jgi:precorrin-6B methylase 2